MTRRHWLSLLSAMGLASAARAADPAPPGTAPALTDAQWKQRLTPEQYRVLRHEGTEPPGSSPLIYPNATTACSNGLEDDGNGFPDCEDNSCENNAACR